MDINTLRGIATLLLFIAFIGMCFWVYSKKRKKTWEEAAQLPFADENEAVKKDKDENAKEE